MIRLAVYDFLLLSMFICFNVTSYVSMQPLQMHFYLVEISN